VLHCLCPLAVVHLLRMPAHVPLPALNGDKAHVLAAAFAAASASALMASVLKRS
jgi:hypothetical protein